MITFIYNPGVSAPGDLSFTNAAGSTAPVPTPSNWVAGQVGVIPDSGTAALLLAGLGAIGMLAHRRRLL
jgi:hypothetical protein